MAKSKNLICPECGSPMIKKWSAKFQRHFYSCIRWPDCNGTHSAHKDGSPMGVPANKETRQLRHEAHEAFHKLWKGEDPQMMRKEAYKWLQKAMGMTAKQCHIGNFDIEQCRKVIKLSKNNVR